MRRYCQFWDTGSTVLGLRLFFGPFEAPSCLVNLTFWSSGEAQVRQKGPEVENVPEGTEPAEMPRLSCVGTEFAAFAEIVVFLCKKQGFGGLGLPRIVALRLRRGGIVNFGALARRFWVLGSFLAPLRRQVAR